MTDRHSAARPLTELQQAILDFIWRHGAATADQIRAALTPNHVLKDASVRTLLRRLEARGYLAHRIEGKTFVYQARMPRLSVAVRATRHLIDRFWGGSAEEFLLGMVNERVLTRDALRRLARNVKDKK